MVQTRVFPGSNLGCSLEGVENGLVARTLAHVGWNKARAAAMLGLSRKGLYNLLERYEAGAPSWRHNRASHNGRNGTR